MTLSSQGKESPGKAGRFTQVSAGSARVRLAGATPVEGAARNANGTFIETLTANAHTALRIAADAAFAGRIERVSLRRLA